jgi:hypothetical protein
MLVRHAYQASKQDLIFSTLHLHFKHCASTTLQFGFLITLMAHNFLMVLLLTTLANPIERGLKLISTISNFKRPYFFSCCVKVTNDPRLLPSPTKNTPTNGDDNNFEINQLQL